MRGKTIVPVAFLLFAAAAAAQNTTVVGTFKTQGGQTPAQAGLKSVATIGATVVYGYVDFVATDLAALRPRELTYGGITFPPQNVRGWIRGDGVLINPAEAAGVLLIPTVGSSPAGLAHCATIFINGTSDGRLKPVVLAGRESCKMIPDQLTVDWATLAAAPVVAPTVSYILQTNGSMSGYLDVGGIAAAPASPSAGNCRFYFNTTSGKLEGRDSAGANCAPGGGGSGTVTSFSAGNLSPLFTTSVATPTTTPALSFSLSTQSANLVFTGPSSGAAAAPTFRALVKGDQVGTTVYTDQANTFGAFLQKFQAGANFNLADPADATKLLKFDLSAIATLTTRTVIAPDANTILVQPLAAVASKWINSISSTTGLPNATQPAFPDISGSLACAQMPALTGDATSSAGSCATSVADASATLRGLVNTGSQTFAGAKTFTSNLSAQAGLTSSLGTITSNSQVLNGSATWNNAAVAFQGLYLNVTCTACAAGSTVLETALAGVTKFKVDKDGNVTAASYSSTSGGYSNFPSQADSGTTGDFWRNGAVMKFHDGTSARTLLSTANDLFSIVAKGTPLASFTNSVTTDQEFAPIYTIPANFLVSGKMIKVRFDLEWVAGATAVSETWYVKLGTTKVVIIGANTPANSSTRNFQWDCTFWGTAAAGASVAVYSTCNNLGNMANGTLTNSVISTQNLATNGTLAIALGITFGATGGADTVKFYSHVVEAN